MTPLVRGERGGFGGRRYDRAVRELTIDGRRIADDTPATSSPRSATTTRVTSRRRKRAFDREGVRASAVKLQKRDNGALFTRAAYNRPYDNENSFGPTYGAHREALELGRDDYVELQAYAARARARLLRDGVRHPERRPARRARHARLQDRLGRPHEHAAAQARRPFGKPMFVSTGGATLEDVDRAVETVRPINAQLCVLQCTAAYPADVEELDLGVIKTLRERYPDVVIGLSDHQNGIAMALVAYMLGARVIEKHFTLTTRRRAPITCSRWCRRACGSSSATCGAPRALGDGVKRRCRPRRGRCGRWARCSSPRAISTRYVLGEADLAAKSPQTAACRPTSSSGCWAGPFSARSRMSRPFSQTTSPPCHAPRAAAPFSRTNPRRARQCSAGSCRRSTARRAPGRGGRRRAPDCPAG